MYVCGELGLLGGIMRENGISSLAKYFLTKGELCSILFVSLFLGANLMILIKQNEFYSWMFWCVHY